MNINRFQYHCIRFVITSLFIAGLAAPTVAAAHCKGKHADGNILPDGHASCGGGDDGSNDSKDSGEAIPQNCHLLSAPGDLNSIRGDGLGDYSDDVDKVRCTTGGTSQPNPSSLVFNNVTRGNLKNAIRKVNLWIDKGNCDPVGCDAEAVPYGVFAEEAASPEDTSPEDMEDISMNVRVYSGADGLEVPHIQSLTPGKFYAAAFNFGLNGTAERWSFQMMGVPVPADFHQGAFCDLQDPFDAISDDVTLYVWPDLDHDGVPDGYTVTTADPEDVRITSSDGSALLPPEIPTTPHPKTATLCSNVDADGNSCGGPGSSDLCHLVSKMDVQFTWHAENQ